MINKFNKIIHNKNNRFFRFIFFLRYLLAIFFIFLVIFFTLPNFFNYEKRGQVIKNYLLKEYNFEIDSYKKIKFKSFPLPTIEIKDAVISFEQTSYKYYVKNLQLKPKFYSIYNYKNFQTSKIIFKNSSINLEFSDLPLIKKFFINQKNKLYLDNLSLKIENNDNILIELKKIKFSNFGYSKNIAQGKIFNKKFKLKLIDNLKKINFKILDTGLSSEITFDENDDKNYITGIFKAKILKTNLKFNFKYEDDKLNIFNSYFRNKNLSFNNDSVVIFNPYFDFNSDFTIEEININYLKKLDLDKILNSKDIIKKINSKNKIKYTSKKFSGDLIDKFYTKIDLAYGRVNYQNEFSITNSYFKCKGNINLLEEYPLLFFDCLIESENAQKLLKKFSIKQNIKNKDLKLNIKGNLNILNKKINFIKISMNENYDATSEDLKFFKESFERILFNKSFIQIFNYRKIKEFIIDVS